MELFSYTASPWLVLYSTGLFHPSDCLILVWLYQWMYSPARSMTSSHVRSSQCPEMHGPGSSYGRRTPRPRRCRGCTPSRSWTGPGRAGPSVPAIPATGNDNRGHCGPRDARRAAAWRRPGPGIVSRRFRVRRRPGAQRRLDPPIPVSAPRFAEHVRDAAAQGPVLIDPRSRVVVVVAAGRDTAARRPSTSANTSASAGRPASSSPCSTGAAGRRPVRGTGVHGQRDAAGRQVPAVRGAFHAQRSVQGRPQAYDAVPRPSIPENPTPTTRIPVEPAKLAYRPWDIVFGYLLHNQS